MKYLIFLILIISYAYTSQLILNRYEEDTQSVDVYHIISKQPIICGYEYGKEFKKVIRCKLSTPIRIDKKLRRDTYFDIYFDGNDIFFRAKKYAKALPIDNKLIDKEVVTGEKIYRHWVVIGAKKEPEILVDRGKKKLNFPVKYAKKETPYIGALDLNGEPVKNKKGAIYLGKIKKLYEQKKYNDVLKLVKQYKSMHHDSFYSEIELYKIRAISALAEHDPAKYEDVLVLGMQWIEDNPSNAHIPEIYMHIVKSYLGKGRLKQAEKYMGLLTAGFADNKYTQMAKIYYAKTIYKQKKRRKEALRIYKEVLYSTKDLHTASLAAYLIANAYLDFKEPTKAKKIFEKVLKSNPEFIKEEYRNSFKLAKRFADAEHYDIALKIAKLLRDIKDEAFQDDLLMYIGLWEEGMGNREEAIRVFNEYLKKFPKGKNKVKVLKHLDSLMLLQTDVNSTKKLEFIDTVLQKYEDKEIQKRALEEKAKLLMSLERYQDVLKMDEELKKYKLDTYVQKSAKAYVIKALNEKKCEEAVRTIEKYKVTLESKYDEEIFTCDIALGLFDDAKKIALKHIETKDLHEKLKWLYLAAKLYKKLDMNKKVVVVGNDVLKLAQTLHEKKYEDILYDIAEAYYNLREYDDLMLKVVQQIEEKFPDDIRNVDLFMKVVHYAQKRQDLMLELNYAKKVIDLQRRYHIKGYSPKIDIVYAHDLQKTGQYEKAKEVLKQLLREKLTDEQKAEVLYLLGEIYVTQKKNKRAIEMFMKCGEVVKNSSWQKLCAENLQLLTEY